MPRHLVSSLVFLAGLLAVGWVGIGYLGNHPLGAAIAAVIALCYLAGAAELYRYDQASAGLARAVDGLDASPANLDDWLARVPAGLRHAVRLRVEGERVALPAPALTPYLVGLLVLLGMLGTLLGMMVTLRGTGLALEGAADLQAVQGSLAAPVKGLGFAFGTSIAGVATSAMLGLLAALARRQRTLAVQHLDAAIAGVLRPFSQAWRREEAFRLLQQQAALMPALVDRLQASADALQVQNLAAAERQLAGQQEFHARTEAAYRALATNVEQALKDSVGESARGVGVALQPVVQATLQAVADQAGALHAQVGEAVRRQLDGVSDGLEAATARVAGQWDAALERQQHAAQALARDLRATLGGFAAGFEQRSSALVEAIATRLETGVAGHAQAWEQALARQDVANAALADRHGQALATAAATFAQQADGLVQAFDQAQARQQRAQEEGGRQQVQAWTAAFDALATTLAERWQQAGVQAAAQQQAVCEALARHEAAQSERLQQQRQSLAAVASGLETQAQAWLDGLRQSQDQLQQALEARDAQRLATWAQAFEELATGLGARWERTGQAAAERQQAICEALARTAADIGEQGRRHAGETLAEIGRLVQTASEAPKAAAEVVAELRQKLSDSMVRDTAMLEERNRLLETLQTLLEAVNHASGEQRGAIDALVTTSADLLERVGTRFTDRIEHEAGKLESAAAQLTGGAAEVAGLGEAFGAAVQAYGQSNEALMERLQQVAAALEQSQSRSDEQLAYYVAQAREVVDLSVLSQKQIIEELQQLASRGTAAA
ncbi:DUF802 domain-containing protein [Xanthomonas massiliensis]|uniref:DUF802 domain-containing protein n=1 Tax=Xanthomonas massiliensis TaxID=1720302 RepID=UPI0008243A74|nr:DUF802 domain-containing protein [Xanthomonas massiliensis]